MTRRRATRPQVHQITNAPPPHSDDLNRRISRYLISMGIRTVCVVLAVLVPGPARWFFAAGAVLIPYVAVLFANAQGTPHRRAVPPVEHRGLDGAPTQPR